MPSLSSGETGLATSAHALAVPPRPATPARNAPGPAGALAMPARIDITRDFIRTKRPCSDGYRWFLRRKEASSDYQALLDALVAEGRHADACWLLDQMGPTDEVLCVDELSADALVFAGSVECRGTAEVSALLRVGRSLRVGGGLRVQGALTVGEELQVGGAVFCEGAARIGSDARIGWSLSVGGALACAGRVRVGWSADIMGAARIEGNALVGHALSVGQDFECLSTVKTGGDLSAATVDVRLGIVSAGSVRGAGHVQAGWGIRAAQDIQAEGAIRAGETLQAGGCIEAGNAYGVFAGLAAPIDAWQSSGFVTAARKPERLLSGWWVEP